MSTHPRFAAGARAVARGLAGVLFRLDVVGEHHVPATGPVLIAPNHTGFLDGPLVWAVAPRPSAVLTKAELFSGPVGTVLGWLGQIPVWRATPDRRALRAGLSVLDDGGALGVFPEGTRGDGRLGVVNDGLAWFALRSGAPVVPVAVVGTAAALPRGRHLPRLRTPVRVAFGAPLIVRPTGDPHARRTIRTAATELQAAHRMHVLTTGQQADQAAVLEESA